MSHRQRQAPFDEPAQTIEAIRKGEVDAFVISDVDQDDRVYVLKAADRHYRMIVESMGEGAVTLSAEGAITYCNPHFVALLGTSRDELLGRVLGDLVTPETRDVFHALLHTAEEPARAEIALHGSDGPVPVAVSATLLDDSDGSNYCLIVNDLRDQRAREQLRAAKDAAELANRTKDDFLAMVSHELRSPITVILGWTRMLQMNRVNRDTLTMAVNSIHQGTARLLKLVEDILDASRLNSGTINLQLEVVDLRESVRTSVTSVQFEADQKPLQLTLRMPEEPVLVQADHDRLQQVMANLLANAMKFTPPHGRIDVEVETGGGFAHVHVRDSGEGIDAAFLPFVFERFRQDDGSTTRAHKGLGLGLAIVKQLVDGHRGSVTAHSDGKGSGATFTVSLPLTAEEPKTAALRTDDPLPSLEGFRVLLVDDETDTVEVMRSILMSSGATVDTATSVQQAIDLATTFTPHVIVSDIAMPGEDGFRFIERIASRVPMLAITGKSAPSDRESILAAGFQRYLRKPIEPEELIRAVHALAQL
jgi:PAS domain S-box-containing protein